MSKMDIVFKNMCKDILLNGTDTKGEKVRPHWSDGTPAYTIKQFGVCNRYNLREEFPMLTLRKTPIKNAFDEILWIWQKKSNNIADLHSHIWDSWADENGSIGKAYGYQLGLKHAYNDITVEGIVNTFGEYEEIYLSKGMDINKYAISKKTHAIRDRERGIWYLDQVDRVLYDLKNNPYSRRILTSIYNHHDLSEMGLYPCAWSMTFNVTKYPGDEKLTLNAVLTQRSQDILAANAFNVAQYSLLLMMFAQVNDMIPGELVHMIADAHIYDRHIPMIEDLIKREEHPAPKVYLNPEIHNFYEFKAEDLVVENYQYGPQIKNIPVAI